MSTGTADPVPPAGATSSGAALDRVHRYLYGELGPQRGPAGAGLDRARALLRVLGDPQDRFRAVHVAGTAGKGSVTTFVASLLRAHGFRVGAHLSPHVHCLLERFQVDGAPAGAHLVEAELDRIRPAVQSVERAGHGRPSFFEVTNAIAFGLFADRVDYGVVETGVGGLLDSTNTISRADKLAVITPIGLDHQDLLGSTLEEIATQKAGILPVGGRAVAARQRSAEVEDALSAEATRRACALRWVDQGPPSVRAWTGPDGTELHLRGQPPLSLGLTGQHQAGNAHLALRAVEAIAARDGWALDADAVWQGLHGATLPGRFERRVVGGWTTVLDGAHNPMKLAALVGTLQEVHPGVRFPWVLAFKQDKDLRAALRVVAPVASAVVATQFAAGDGDHPAGASVPAGQIALAATECGVASVVEEDPACAVARAAASADAGLPVVVSGSFHLLAAVGPGSTPR
ncbi:bifunctional folylpolyglutamate synthase/dihydrofolate synthase [Geodermatophilus sp. SYSU D00742]